MFSQRADTSQDMARRLHKSVSLLILTLFILSLVPTGNMQTAHIQADLSELIQSMQALNQESYDIDSAFDKTFRKSINTLQKVAGLNLMILEKNSSSNDGTPVLIAVSARLPYLITGKIKIDQPSLGLPLSFDKTDFLYKSTHIIPDTPPPMMV